MLIEGINRQSAEQLGIEVGGFLRHDFAGEGDVANLRDAAGIHQENDIGRRAALQVREGLSGIADVGNILLVADGFFRKVQDSFQQYFMQLHHVERLLADGKAAENARRHWDWGDAARMHGWR